jgi:hypothetical protein
MEISPVEFSDFDIFERHLCSASTVRHFPEEDSLRAFGAQSFKPVNSHGWLSLVLSWPRKKVLQIFSISVLYFSSVTSNQ